MKLSPLSFLRRTLPRWYAQQELAPSSPQCGAWINPAMGLPDPSHVGTAALLTGAAWLALWGPRSARAQHWRRAELAAAWLVRVQRRSGLIDLPSCNWDSAPDTGFVVQLLCATLERTRDEPAAAPLRALLLRFVRRALPGLARGGFHTPNHRWVIASALAWGAQLTGDRRGAATLSSYLREGIDQDADGAYQERSPAVYDAVTNRSLALLARHAGWKPARPAIARNLSLIRTLLHPDGTIESAQSRRQDCAWRVAPTSLAAVAWENSDRALARWLWQQAAQPTLNDALWLLFALTTDGGSPTAWPPTAREPGAWNGVRLLPALGLARLRRGALSATAFTGRAELLRVHAPSLALRAVSAALPYFGVGQLWGKRLRAHGSALTLALAGLPHPRRPGYELPLGRPVNIDDWEDSLAARPLRRLPALRGSLRVELNNRALSLTLETNGGLPGIPVQFALDFEPGVEMRVGQRWRRAKAGDVLFLGAGEFLEIRHGATTWRLGPGASAHRMHPMRDAWAPTDTVRVVVALAQPARHQLRLRQIAR